MLSALKFSKNERYVSWSVTFLQQIVTILNLLLSSNMLRANTAAPTLVGIPISSSNCTKATYLMPSCSMLSRDLTICLSRDFLIEPLPSQGSTKINMTLLNLMLGMSIFIRIWSRSLSSFVDASEELFTGASSFFSLIEYRLSKEMLLFSRKA